MRSLALNDIGTFFASFCPQAPQHCISIALTVFVITIERSHAINVWTRADKSRRNLTRQAEEALKYKPIYVAIIVVVFAVEAQDFAVLLSPTKGTVLALRVITLPTNSASITLAAKQERR